MFDETIVYVVDNKIQQCFLVKEVKSHKLVQEISYEGFENDNDWEMKWQIWGSHKENLKSLGYKFVK